MSNPLANELNAILTTPAEEARTILTRLGVPASTFVPAWARLPLPDHG